MKVWINFASLSTLAQRENNVLASSSLIGSWLERQQRMAWTRVLHQLKSSTGHLSLDARSVTHRKAAGEQENARQT